MDTQICFFEDNLLSKFHPLTLSRPIFDLRTGILTLGRKWHLQLQSQAAEPQGILRSQLKGNFAETVPKTGPVLWINPRFLPTPPLAKQVSELKINEALLNKDQLVAGLVTKDTHNLWADSGYNLQELNVIQFDPEPKTVLENIWDLFLLNGSEIKADISRIGSAETVDPAKYPGVHFVNSKQVFAGKGVVIEPGAVIVAEKGPVYLGENCTIMANSVVRGPSAICEESVVKAGSKIYEETTIGPVCKVAGEISNSVFHSYCNKAHDGFVGNSLFGQWCNLGADTNTSNLKNNYSTIRLTDWESGEEYETGQQFIGTIMGDHSKTGINAMLNTGTVCGVSCNIFASGYPPKFIPSFRWVSDNDMIPYQFDKALETMRRMMARRGKELTPEYEKMMRAIAGKES